jgi:hypothetical protein
MSTAPNNSAARRPFLLWIFVFFMLFLAFGGLYGGGSMLADPSGKLLQMDTVLEALRVPNYILPGLFLIGFMGVLPLGLSYGLIARPDWPVFRPLHRWNGQHWAWTGSIGLGILLAFWLVVQGSLIGFRWPIQYVTIINDLAILGLGFTPPLKRYFTLERSKP